MQSKTFLLVFETKDVARRKLASCLAVSRGPPLAWLMSLLWLRFVPKPGVLETDFSTAPKGSQMLPGQNQWVIQNGIFITMGNVAFHDQNADSLCLALSLCRTFVCFLYLGTLSFMSGICQSNIKESTFPDSLEAKVKPCDQDFSNQTHPHEILT